MLKRSLQSANSYLSMVKFSHTIFAMPFALIGFFLAIGSNIEDINLKLLGLIILCMVFARNAAMAFNRFADKEIDLKNPRTSIREIPAGIIKPRSALLFTIINALLFMATTWFINPLTFKLSPVALFVVMGYSLTKKFTALCHFILGIGLSLAPIGAYISVTGKFELLPLIYSMVVFTWVSGFDIIYALQDQKFDRHENLKSIPVLIGKSKALTLSTILHFFTALLVILAGINGGQGSYYWIGELIFISLLFYQHLLVKPDDLSKVNLAFFTTNGIASVLFALFTILDLYI
ncbi:MAG: UbiA-like polyprenyltransferase [Bacteroidota bacterium]|nr:UbiA-like polyprenyltransferase [Bacteroidota bacterium]